MPLFSFLSGYVYALRPYRHDPAAFIAGKARRLLDPMLIVGTLFALLQTVTPGTNFKGYNWPMLHIIPVAHYWFLESLFLIFIVIVALEHFKAMATERRFAVVLFAAACLHVAEPFPVYFGLLGAAYLLPFVLLGIWCNRFGNRHCLSASSRWVHPSPWPQHSIPRSWPRRCPPGVRSLRWPLAGCVRRTAAVRRAAGLGRKVLVCHLSLPQRLHGGQPNFPDESRRVVFAAAHWRWHAGRCAPARCHGAGVEAGSCDRPGRAGGVEATDAGSRESKRRLMQPEL